MNKRSMAQRMLWPLGIALALIITAAALVMHAALAQSYAKIIDARLTARMSMLLTAVEYDHGRIDFDAEESLASYVPDMAEQWAISIKGGALLWHSQEQEHQNSAHFRSKITEMQVPKSTKNKIIQFAVWTNAEQELNALIRADLIIATMMPLLYAASMLFIYFIIKRELRPLEQIAQQAQAIDLAAMLDVSQTISFVGTRRQAREIESLSAALTDMVARLRLVLQRERQFSAAAAHELRTPVAQLISGLEISLRKQRDQATYRADMEAALTDGRRLSHLIAALLSFNTQESMASNQQVTLLDIIGEIRAAGLEPTLSVANAVDQGAKSEQIQVSGTGALYAIVLRNLIDNAQRYAGGLPSIDIEVDATHVFLRVADNGPGVPPAERERIFQALVRLDAARTIDADDGGFGLGLSIVATLVQRVQGQIRCLANPGGGALFELRLAIIS